MRAVLLVLALIACSAVAEDRSAVHDFDFLFGDWQVHHLRLKERLVGSTEWIEFDGRQSTRAALGGARLVLQPKASRPLDYVRGERSSRRILT